MLHVQKLRHSGLYAQVATHSKRQRNVLTIQQLRTSKQAKCVLLAATPTKFSIIERGSRRALFFGCFVLYLIALDSRAFARCCRSYLVRGRILIVVLTALSRA